MKIENPLKITQIWVSNNSIINGKFYQVHLIPELGKTQFVFGVYN